MPAKISNGAVRRPNSERSEKAADGTVSMRAPGKGSA